MNPYLLLHSGQPRHQVGYLAFHIFQYLLIPCQALHSALWNILSFINSKKINLAQDTTWCIPIGSSSTYIQSMSQKGGIYLLVGLCKLTSGGGRGYRINNNKKKKKIKDEDEFRIYMYQSKIRQTDYGMFPSLFWGGYN